MAGLPYGDEREVREKPDHLKSLEAILKQAKALSKALRERDAARAIAASQSKLLRQCRNWFKANYSYVYEDKDVMQLWGEIDDELDKGLSDE